MPVDASSFSISPQTKPSFKETKTDNKIFKILKLSKRGRKKGPEHEEMLNQFYCNELSTKI
jgi:hypothetical protein